MKHLDDERLVLHYYAEDPDAVEVDAHLEACAVCRDEYRELQAVLEAAGAMPVPERGEDYGRHAWKRLERRLGTPKRAPRWAWAAAMAAMLVLAFLAGRHWPRDPQQSPAGFPQPARERILLVAVGDHLERSQGVLVELDNVGRGATDISAEQQRAEELLSANRIYRQTAAGAGEAAVAGVLEELERILTEIARDPSRLSPADVVALQGRVDRMLFKVRVAGAVVRERGNREAI